MFPWNPKLEYTINITGRRIKKANINMFYFAWFIATATFLGQLKL